MLIFVSVRGVFDLWKVFYSNPVRHCDPDEPFRWNLGRLSLDHVGIIFIKNVLYSLFFLEMLLILHQTMFISRLLTF